MSIKVNKKIAITFAMICLLLTFCIVLQVRTIEDASSPIAKLTQDDELRDEVLKWKEKYDICAAQLKRSDKKLYKLRKKAAQSDSEAQSMQEEIKNNNDFLGKTDVTGPGIVITIKASSIDNQLKEDLDSIINELKNAGAESFEINEQRIIFNSVITCKENTIEVNGTSIQSPFIIQAIGDSKMIYNALMRPGGYIELLNKRVDKVQVTKANRITIKKTDAKFSTKYMKTVT